MSSSTSKAPDSPVDPAVSSSSIGAPEASPRSVSSPVSPWLAPSASGPLNACVRLLGSKSQSARFLYLAAVASGPSRLRGVLDSRDTRLLASALETLGAQFESEEEGSILVHPLDLHACLGEARVAIECGLAGTVMRFLPPLAALFHTPVRFDGDPAARRRPLAPLLDTLSHLGAQIEFEGEPGFLPFSVTGPLRVPADGVLRVDASASSQFLSAMLLLAPLLGAPLIVEAPGRVVSLPHVEMTCEALRRCGCVVEQINEDGSEPLSWRVLPGAPRPQELSVEPDLSNAGPFLAAAMICGGRVRVQDWPERTKQAGDAWRQILADMGGLVEREGSDLLITGPAGGRIRGIDIDMSQIGELAPTLAALAACASSPSSIRGIAHLRGHETDRLAALAHELREAGCGVEELADGLEIIPAPLIPGLRRAYGDHRMATFAAIIGLKAPGTSLDDIASTSKTIPGFARMWEELLGTSGERS